MIKISVNVSKSYDIIIGNNILNDTGEYIKSLLSPEKAVIITDDIVDSLYSKTVESSLEKNGIETKKFVIKNGEASKNGENFLEICEFLAEKQVTRKDIIIALGGGVVGDLAGFVSASYLRGIDFVQIPTTLLAAVDSSVGGKTAIDISNGKNLVGAFHQPSLVICDYSTLDTLTPQIFSQGCAEVIKYAVIGNEKLFSHLEEYGFDFDREFVISQCVKMKKDLVEKDEFDKGERQLLNLGHTIGHAIELNSNFSVSHGEAVGAGMCIIAKSAYKKSLCSKETYLKTVNLVEKFKLPTDTKISAENLYYTALKDKKRSGKYLNLIIPYSIGNSKILKIKTEELLSFIKDGI